MAQSALIGAFLVGLFGGLHCLAMCGGYVAAISGGNNRQQPLISLRILRHLQAAAHAGRLATYALLGAAFGGAGGAALALSWEPIQRFLYVAANLLLLALAVAVARGNTGFPALERAGLHVYLRALPIMRPFVRGSGLFSRFGFGLLWGLTPCALVYGVLPVALLAGGTLDGALVMLAFGLGTLPNLLAATWIAGRTRSVLAGRRLRLAAAAIIAAFAVAGLWRAMFGPGPLTHGPFCIVP